jgi:hypothetical protein
MNLETFMVVQIKVVRLVGRIITIVGKIQPDVRIAKESMCHIWNGI